MRRILKIASILPLLILYACGGSADNLKEGQSAPDFTLQDAYGQSYRLSAFRGVSPVVIYFYPKAGTPGCTKEACSFRDNIDKFKENKIPVFGISVDPKENLREFINEYNLNFPLLSDENKEVSKKYGVLNKLGKDSRITFIVDKEGRISHIIRDVNVTTHSTDVYGLVSKLM